MRVTQTKTCQNCGHSSSQEIKYPKYGADETPLWIIARRSRCVRCGTKGRCLLEEEGLFFDANGPIPVKGPP